MLEEKQKADELYREQHKQEWEERDRKWNEQRKELLRKIKECPETLTESDEEDLELMGLLLKEEDEDVTIKEEPIIIKVETKVVTEKNSLINDSIFA